MEHLTHFYGVHDDWVPSPGPEAPNPDPGTSVLPNPAPLPFPPPRRLEGQDSAAKVQGLLQKLKDFLQKPASEPPVVIAAQKTLQETLALANEKYEKAKESGVDAAHANFLTRMVGLGVSALFFGVAAALTVATGGAAAPMLAITGVRLLVAAGDAYCAYKAWTNPLKKPPEAAPPMGSNTLANLAYWACDKLRPGQPEWATKVATRFAAVAGLALTAAGVATAMVGPPPEAAGWIARFLGTSLSASMSVFDVGATYRHVRNEEERLKALRDVQKHMEFIGDADSAAQAVGVVDAEALGAAERATLTVLLQPFDEVLAALDPQEAAEFLRDLEANIDWRFLEASQGKPEAVWTAHRPPGPGAAEPAPRLKSRALKAWIGRAVDLRVEGAASAASAAHAARFEKGLPELNANLRKDLQRYVARMEANDPTRTDPDNNLFVRKRVRDLGGLLDWALFFKAVIFLSHHP